MGTKLAVEGVVLVVVERVIVLGVLVAGLEDLPGLLRHFRLGPQLQQPPREAACRLVILVLEAEVGNGGRGRQVLATFTRRNHEIIHFLNGTQCEICFSRY